MKQIQYYDFQYFGGFREKRLELDNYTCQKCSSKDNLQVHHLQYPARSVNHLITLCISCHQKISKNILNKYFTRKRKGSRYILSDDDQLKFIKIFGEYFQQLKFSFSNKKLSLPRAKL